MVIISGTEVGGATDCYYYAMIYDNNYSFKYINKHEYINSDYCVELFMWVPHSFAHNTTAKQAATRQHLLISCPNSDARHELRIHCSRYTLNCISCSSISPTDGKECKLNIYYDFT